MDPANLPCDIQLADGRRIRFRPMVADDVAGMLAFFRGLPLEDRQYLRNDVTREDVVQRFVTDEFHDDLLAIVVEADGRIVGSGTLQRERYGWMTHVGEIRLVIAHEFQRQGVGAALIRILLRQAMACGIEKAVAAVMDGHLAAMRAMERLGFHKEAVLLRHVKDVQGNRHDLVYYTDDVSHVWDRMEALMADYSPTLGG